jgi:hypothetical protein
VYLDSASRQRVGVREDVRSASVATNAEREHMRMLDKQQQIADAVRSPILDELALQRQPIGIWHAAETPHFERPIV